MGVFSLLKAIGVKKGVLEADTASDSALPLKAKEYFDDLQKIVDTISKQLADFDANAQKARQALSMANAKKDLQALREQQNSDLTKLSSLSSSSSALSALARKAAKVNAEAEAMEVVNNVTQKPVDQENEIQKLRDQYSGQPVESPAERLKRLATGG